MRTEFLCISVLRVASGPRLKLAGCKSALNPTVVCSTDRSKAVVPVLVLLFVALWFILRGDLLFVFPCVILFLCFSVLLVLRLPCLGKRELVLVLFVRLFGLCLFRFVGFLFLLGSGKGCGLWLWHSLDFSLSLFAPGWGLGQLLEHHHFWYLNVYLETNGYFQLKLHMYFHNMMTHWCWHLCMPLTYISWFSDFASILEYYFADFHHFINGCSIWHSTWPHIMSV